MYFSKELNKFENIKHHFFSRNNGFSKEIYKSLNCGKGSMDKKEDVSKNLQYVSEYIGVKNKNLILMNQTHSNKVTVINQKNKIERIHIKAKPKEIKELKKFSILDKIRFIEFPKWIFFCFKVP